MGLCFSQDLDISTAGTDIRTPQNSPRTEKRASSEALFGLELLAHISA